MTTTEKELLKSAFVSTKKGLFINTVEAIIGWGLIINMFITFYTWIIPEDPSYPIPVTYLRIVLTVSLGIFIGIGWGQGNTSIIGYRLFPPTEEEISSYKIKQKATFQKKIDKKEEEIQNLKNMISGLD